MPFALNLIYAAALVVFSPLLFYRWLRDGKYREGWAEKLLGKAPLRIGEDPCLWFHAVSVGEVLLLRPLVQEMARRRPNWQVVISTSTSTGLAVARRAYPDLVTFYAPLDFSWSTRRAIARIRPTVLALVELELWPNLIRAAKRSGAKVAIINARLSTRSYRGYRSVRRPLQPTLGRIDVVAAQNGEYARRFVDLGIPSHRISVTGSVKYDGLESDRNNAKTRELRQLAGSGSDRPGLRRRQHDGGGGAAVLAAYNTARRQHRGLRLILVPRHAERFDEVARWLKQNNETVVQAQPVDEPGSAGMGSDASDHLDRHDRRAFGDLGPGRRGVRGRKPASRPGRPEHDGTGRVWCVGDVRAAHRELSRDGRSVAQAQRCAAGCRRGRADTRSAGRSRRSREPRPLEVPPGETSCWRSTGPPGERLLELDRLVESSLAGAATD